MLDTHFHAQAESASVWIISYYDKSGVILQGNKNFNKATFVKIKTFGSKIL